MKFWPSFLAIIGAFLALLLTILSFPELFPIRQWIASISRNNPVPSWSGRDLNTDQLQFDPQIKTLTSNANEILERVGKVTARYGLSPVSGPEFKPNQGWIQSPSMESYQPTGPEIKLQAPGYQFGFREQDGVLIEYSNDRASDSIDGKNAPMYDSPNKPKWTLDKAIEVGTAFRNALMQTSPSRLGDPMAEFVHTSFNGKQSRGGHWMVSWPRIDHGNHPFYADHVTLQISEEGGVFGAGFFLFTPYVETTAVPLSKAVAIDKAQRVIFWRQSGKKLTYLIGSFDEYEKNVIAHKVISADLMVTMPYPLSSESSGKTARLAWIIWFDPIHATPPTGSVYNDNFAIWIDAYTGEVIGGDAML